MTTIRYAGTSAPGSTHLFARERFRTLVIGLISFLTLVDLFAAQAILPSLARAYGVTPAAMGTAVNASTFGMAVSGILVALFSSRIDRRRGIWVSLALLSIPTALLGLMPDLTTFTFLRVVQGVFMSAAFTLMVAYLAERCSVEAAAGALAAYVTGNVASNLFGRLLSAALADHLGLSANFQVFALLNLAGAVLVFLSLTQTTRSMAFETDTTLQQSSLRNVEMSAFSRFFVASYAIGFLILFVFIGTFTYVNFVLVHPPLSLSPMALGFVYFVFLPSMLTTPLAGRIARRIGVRPALWIGFGVAGLGLVLLLPPWLPVTLAGMALVGVGTFFAQASATGFVSRAATANRAAASGLYLASYYCGGLVGSAVLGAIFARFGWPACVAVMGLAMCLAAAAAMCLHGREAHPTGSALSPRP
jgi:MFS transporter, YNFM family, putative membrane transport protein